MDIIAVLRSYVESVLSNVQDAKVLLFDNETAEIAGLVYSQTELLRHDVVLIERLRARLPKPVDDWLSPLQCVCILRPTPQNIHDLCSELNCPHFNTYYIFFTNAVRRDTLQQIAYADHGSKVFVVHEIFMDVLALNKRLFSLNIPFSIHKQDEPTIQRIVDGIFSILCAFKLRSGIRFDVNSAFCQLIGDRLARQISENQDLFQSPHSNALTIIIDRRTDPITPLLHSWSYQSLIHELLGIRNNIVSLKSEAKKTICLDERTDEFFGQNLFQSFGDLGKLVTGLTDGVKKGHTDVKDVKDVDGLKRFISAYPLYQQKKALAAKHTGLLSEVSSIIRRENLIEFGPMEQKLAVNDDFSNQLHFVLNTVRDVNITEQNALRVALLYALHYEQSGAGFEEVKGALNGRHRGDYLVAVFDAFLAFCGQGFQRQEPLFAAKSFLSKARDLIGRDENKFSLYQPAISGVLQKLEKKQADSGFRAIDGVQTPHECRRIVLFFVGGVTYEEARLVYECVQRSGLDVIVGGTNVHNMSSFLVEEVYRK
jgi:vacuolar protein sorting-associated protein 45